MRNQISVKAVAALMLTMAEDADSEALTVLVHDYAEIGESGLRRAKHEAARILRTAGVT